MKIKKQKAQKSVSYKENLNFKIIKTVQKQQKLKTERTIQKKNEIDVDSLKEAQKGFTKHKKLTLKTQQIFKSESQNIFTED